MKQYKF